MHCGAVKWRRCGGALRSTQEPKRCGPGLKRQRAPRFRSSLREAATAPSVPTVYAANDAELVNLLGRLPELNYPMFLVTHKDIRQRAGVKAFFEFCPRGLKPALLCGAMRHSREETKTVR